MMFHRYWIFNLEPIYSPGPTPSILYLSIGLHYGQVPQSAPLVLFNKMGFFSI